MCVSEQTADQTVYLAETLRDHRLITVIIATVELTSSFEIHLNPAEPTLLYSTHHTPSVHVQYL